jgi:hypothetical protein
MAASGSERGEGLAVVGVEYGKSVLYNGLAEYERAAEAAHRASSAGTLGIPDWALYELVEAAVKSGHPDRGSAAGDRLSQIAAASGSEWARGTAALARIDGRERRGRAGRPPLSRGDPAVRPHPDGVPSPASAPLLWRVVAEKQSRFRGRHSAEGRIRRVYGHGGQGLCRTCPP